MTSWKRGNRNEDKGEDLMRKPEITEKAKGAALKAAGEIEQGINNVADKLTGKQDDWKGMGKKGSSRESHGKSARSHSAHSHESHTHEAHEGDAHEGHSHETRSAKDRK